MGSGPVDDHDTPPGSDGLRHPTLAAALLMVGTVVVIVVMALLSATGR